MRVFKDAIDVVFAVSMLLMGIAIGAVGGQHLHDVLDKPHVVEAEAEHGHGQPFDIPPDTGFTMFDGEMILVVDGDRVLTFYRDTLAEVCKNVGSAE